MKLTEAYPLMSSHRDKCLLATGVGTLVFLFLLVFQPFGLSTITEQKFIIISGYGIISAVVALLHMFLVERIFKESTWTVWKDISFLLWVALAVTCANYFYTVHVISPSSGQPFSFISFIFYTYSVSIFPNVALVLVNQNRLYLKHFKVAELINKEVHKENKTNTSSNIIDQTLTLSGIYNTAVNLTPFQILYIESLGNYVIIHYEKNRSEQSIKIRNTLKSIRDQLNNEEIFFQTHRAFIVNLSQIKHITGNAQGLKLQVKFSSSLVPVSRNFVQKFNDIFKK